MYKSPIELLVTDIQNQIVKQQDEEIYKAVLHYVPNVDKEELIRALNYDRQQYQKGYLDGKADAVVHGRWEQVQRWATKAKYRCSVCGREIMSATKVNIEKYPYCHCGAKMDEKP